MKWFLLVLISGVSYAALCQHSERHNGWSRSELGILFGGSYYIGDLNQKHLKNTHFAGQLMYRYNVHSRLAIRGNFTYGFVEGSDQDATRTIFLNRNLSFQSKIYELGTGVEFTYLPFEIGSKRYRGTAYLLAELALARINPTTMYNGQQVELQPLGTEGQGTSLSDRSKYSKTQLTVPLGIGARFTISENVGFNIEYGIRFMFTDYLDDIGSYRYVDPVALQAANGPMAAALSNRTLDGTHFGQRGNPTTRDWYAFFGAGISVRLGGKNPCPSAL
jgi:opacity protein-like surface antigen